MNLKVTFEIKDKDLKYFRDELRRALKTVRIADDEEIVQGAREALTDLRKQDVPDYLAHRLDRIETMIAMVVDADWAFPKTDREPALAALAYFSDPEDIVPDDVPTLGFLDDAIMIELVLQELEHEMDAYDDFEQYRTELDAGETVEGRDDKLRKKRESLYERMRRRRAKSREKDASSAQPAALW